jgi:predicted esterase
MSHRNVDKFSWGVLAFGALALFSCAPPESTPDTGSGGAPAAGSGGSASGGSSTGGSASGGSASGGSSTGGSASGGSASGGRGTGGSGTGGSASGGSGTGGRFAGGGRGGSAVGSGGAPGGTGGSGGPGGAGGPMMSAGCGMTGAPTSNTYTISVGGTNRTYILKVPTPYEPNKAYKLIVAYHWLNGTAQNVSSENYYGLWNLSQGSTIFVAPQGIGNAWNDSGRTSTMGGQDINFTKALVTDLTNKLCIDKTRIFAEGFSMGGSMSYAAACAMGDVFRAVVAHSGGPMSGCVQHTKPVAYFMTHGTTDNVCTYPGFGVPQINDFGRVNGCGTQAMPMPSGSEHLCVDFPNCMSGYPARACIFVGGHTPSPPGNWVPMESWKFLSQF